MPELDKYLLYLDGYLKQKVKGFNGYILGLSGGLDSAVVALLAQKAIGDDLLCVIIDIDSDPADIQDAISFCEINNIRYLNVDLSEEYHALVNNLENHQTLNNLSRINTKVRLRMVTLYALGQTNNMLVLGTDNKAELYTGYFTKWGDGGVDLYVISSLTKGEVFEVGRRLGVTQNILKKVPSAGLYFGQSDESELGISYAELDAFLLGKRVSKKVSERINYLHKISEHKRRKIIAPKDFKR
ncbi:MAG: NAD(+) synthase [Bacilli bacterium]